MKKLSKIFAISIMALAISACDKSTASAPSEQTTVEQSTETQSSTLQSTVELTDVPTAENESTIKNAFTTEPAATKYTDIETYTSIKNEEYKCSFDDNEYKINVLHNGKEYTNTLDKDVYKRMQDICFYAQTDKDIYETQALQCGIAREKVDIDGWIGDMVCAFARNNEKLNNEDTYYDYAMACLKEMETIKSFPIKKEEKDNKTEIKEEMDKNADEYESNNNHRNKTISLAETRWDIDPSAKDTQSKQVDIYVNSGTNKYQIFYNADSEAPEIELLSAGGNTYIAGKDYDDSNGFCIKTIKRTPCAGHTDIKYDTIYISGAPDPGTWTMQVTIPPTTINPLQKLIITKSTADPNWKSLHTEYKTSLEDFYCWYLDINNSADAAQSIMDIISAERTPIAAKPVIYLYGYNETVKVKLDLNDARLSCTYPEYKNGWEVKATPDGHLTDKSGITYRYLYWEATSNKEWDMSTGFCVKGSDTAKFLEEKLAILGLNDDEINEFIIYWLPQMENNPYNIITFQTEEYEDHVKLTVNPAPDKMIRVFMTWKPSNEMVKITPQKLIANLTERDGKTVVEWGGAKVE